MEMSWLPISHTYIYIYIYIYVICDMGSQLSNCSIAGFAEGFSFLFTNWLHIPWFFSRGLTRFTFSFFLTYNIFSFFPGQWFEILLSLVPSVFFNFFQVPWMLVDITLVYIYIYIYMCVCMYVSRKNQLILCHYKFFSTFRPVCRIIPLDVINKGLPRKETSSLIIY